MAVAGAEQLDGAVLALLTRADLVLSLHNDANRSMHAQGLATFYFGNGSGATSTVGEALAGFYRELPEEGRAARKRLKVARSE